MLSHFLSRRPPLLRGRPATGALLSPAVFAALPMPDANRPAVRWQVYVMGGVAAVGIHLALLAWLQTDRPSKPLEVPTKPLAIAMQMVTPPSPPAPVQAPKPEPTPPPPPPPPPPVAKPSPAPKAVAKATPRPAEPKQVVAPAPPRDTPTKPFTPSANATPAPNPPAPLPVTGPVGRAGYLNNPAPTYPPAAARRHQEGTAQLRVHVMPNGRPDTVEIASSSGSPALDEAALAAVRQWTFIPAKRGDTAIDGWVTVPLEFKLSR
ncbi:energy transducer TonB [Pseudomonas trivialis]